MKVHRTTITLPLEVYRTVKLRAAYEDKSVSRFIRDLLQGKSRKEQPLLPFGKYQLKTDISLKRQDIYETHFRNKVSR